MNATPLRILVVLYICVLPVASFAQTTSVQGIVTRSGSTEPLSKATVEIRNDDIAGAVIDSFTTEEDGRFVIPNVRPGRYRLTATRQGYFRAPLSITVGAGQPPRDIQLPMTATGAINGHVADSAGQPVGNLVVQALKASYPEGQRVLAAVQSVITNDLGEFRLFWLSPGRYYVVAIPPESESPTLQMMRMSGIGTTTIGGNSRVFYASSNSDPAVSTPIARELESEVASPERFVPVYFSGTTDEQTATPVDVRAGSDFGGVNIVVGPVREHHVRGVILDAATDKPAEYPSVDIVGDSSRPIRPSEKAEVNRDAGAFDITLLPGTHTLVASSASGTGYALVRVADTDVNNVVIRTTRGFDLKGRITLEGGGNPADLGQLRMTMRPVSLRPAGSRSYSNPLPDGSFTLDGEIGDSRVNIAPILNITPNVFGVTLPPALQNAYVKSMTLANKDVLNAPIHLDKPPEGLLEIVLATNPGAVEGNTGAGDVTVVLLPDVRMRTELYRNTVSDSSGRYRFDGVPPGDYKVFAWTEVENGAWYDPEFMRNNENSGSPVRVVEGQTSR